MAETRSAVIEYPVELTPVTRKVARDSMYRAVDAMGLINGREVLLREAARLERLADKNAVAGRERGATSKRNRATKLRKAAGVLDEIHRQIDGCYS